MIAEETMSITRQQEQEIINILIDSSLYLDMPQADRKQLIRYLILLFFHPRSQAQEHTCAL